MRKINKKDLLDIKQGLYNIPAMTKDEAMVYMAEYILFIEEKIDAIGWSVESVLEIEPYSLEEGDTDEVRLFKNAQESLEKCWKELIDGIYE